jgi:secondary thiamine-phosphate synthase enzyme
MIETLTFSTTGQALYEITSLVDRVLKRSGLHEGLATVFVRHTSASLCIQENADPSAKRDLEKWLKRLVKENDPIFTHTAEGPDDMPSHIKSVLTSTSLSIPFQNGSLLLGTWQGIYLWEHREHPQSRKIAVHLSC